VWRRRLERRVRAATVQIAGARFGFGEGLPNSEIAQRLHLAEGTVRNYLSSAIVKLGARNRIEAYAKAHEMGYL
jgi:predicted transcriptional regulator